MSDHSRIDSSEDRGRRPSLTPSDEPTCVGDSRDPSRARPQAVERIPSAAPKAPADANVDVDHEKPDKGPAMLEQGGKKASKRMELDDMDKIRELARKEIAESHDPFSVGFEHEDPEDPRNMSKAKKWAILTIALVTQGWANAISSALAPAIPAIAEELNVSVTAARTVQACYLYAFAFGAVALTPLSEDYGRRWTHIVSVAMMGLFQLPCALAPNFAVLVVFRSLAGFFAAATFNSVGTISDIFDPEDQGWPVNSFAIAAELGAAIGPVFGGYMFVGVGWRWSFGIFGIVSAALLAIYLVSVPETRAGVILTRRAAKRRQQTGESRWFARHERERQSKTVKAILQETLLRPVYMLFTEPIVFWLALFDGFNYAIVYLFLEAFGLVYGAYGFSTGAQGLPFIGFCVGCIIAYLLFPLQAMWEARAARRSPNGVMPPEATLGWAVPGSILFPVSLFWFAWTSQPSIHFMVSIVAGAAFGISSHIIFISVSAYTVMSYQLYSGSAVGAQSLLREILSGSVTYAAEPMYEHLGYQWASSLLGFIAVALAGAPIVLWALGPRIRARSGFYNEIRLAEAKALEEKRMAKEEYERTNTTNTSTGA